MSSRYSSYGPLDPSLGDLGDVDLSGVTDEQVLSYDAASSTWIPATAAGGGSSDFAHVGQVEVSTGSSVGSSSVERIGNAGSFVVPAGGGRYKIEGLLYASANAGQAPDLLIALSDDSWVTEIETDPFGPPGSEVVVCTKWRFGTDSSYTLKPCAVIVDLTAGTWAYAVKHNNTATVTMAAEGSMMWVTRLS